MKPNLWQVFLFKKKRKFSCFPEEKQNLIIVSRLNLSLNELHSEKFSLQCNKPLIFLS